MSSRTRPVPSEPAEPTVAAPLGVAPELPAEGLCLKSTLASIEAQLIEQALQRSGGVVAHAARLLGVGRTTLLEKLRKRPGLVAVETDDE